MNHVCIFVTSLPSSLLPLGLFAPLILPQVLRRDIMKEARIKSLEDPPRVLQNQSSEGKGAGGERNENTNPRSIGVKGWKSSSQLLSVKFFVLSTHKGFILFILHIRQCFAIESICWERHRNWFCLPPTPSPPLLPPPPPTTPLPRASWLGSWAVVFANFMGNMIISSAPLLLLI